MNQCLTITMQRQERAFAGLRDIARHEQWVIGSGQQDLAINFRRGSVSSRDLSSPKSEFHGDPAHDPAADGVAERVLFVPIVQCVEGGDGDLGFFVPKAIADT